MSEPKPERSARRTAAERIVRAAPRRRTPPPPEEPSGVGDVLRNRPFLLIWLSQLSTQVGGNMVLYGLTVVASGYSNTAVAGLFLSYLVPAVIFSAVAGVYVDQVDRRHMLVVTNVLRGLAYLAIFFIGNNLLLMYPLVIFVATVTTFFGPAEASMIPTLVPRRQLVAANGLFTLTMNVAFAAGFALLGPIVAKIFGPAILLLLVAALYGVAAIFCWTLPSSPTAKPAPVTPAGAFGDAERAVESMFADLREGTDYIRKNPTVGWALSYQAITASLIGVVGTLGPDFANTALGLSKSDFFVVVLPLGIGLAFGILLLNSYGRFLPRRRVIEGGLIALGIVLGILSVAGPIARFLQGQANKTGLTDIGGLLSLLSIVIVLGFLAGIAYAFVAISSQTQLQEDVHEDVRGRIFGVLQMLVSIASFVPIIIVAPIADLVGVPSVLLVVAALVSLSGVFSVIRRGPMAPEEANVRAPSEPVGAPVDMVTVAIGGGEFRSAGADRAAGTGRTSTSTSTTTSASATSTSTAAATMSAGKAPNAPDGNVVPPISPASATSAAASPPDAGGAAAPPDASVETRGDAGASKLAPAEATPVASNAAASGADAGLDAAPESGADAAPVAPATSSTAPAAADAGLDAAPESGADAAPVAPATSSTAPAAAPPLPPLYEPMPEATPPAGPLLDGTPPHDFRAAEAGVPDAPAGPAAAPRREAKPGKRPKRGVTRRSPLEPEPGTSFGERLRRLGALLRRQSDEDGDA